MPKEDISKKLKELISNAMFDYKLDKSFDADFKPSTITIHEPLDFHKFDITNIDRIEIE